MAEITVRLERLRSDHPGYEFWHVPCAVPPSAWCWRPEGGGPDTSQNRPSPDEVHQAIRFQELEAAVRDAGGELET
jgi:hypothetical protein